MEIEFLKTSPPLPLSLSLSLSHTHTHFTHVKMHRPTHSEEPLYLFESNAAATASQVALEVKNPPANAGDISDVGSIPGSGKTPGGGNGKPLQNSCLENPTDKWAWWAAVHGVAKNHTQLKLNWTHMHPAAILKLLTILSKFHIFILPWALLYCSRTMCSPRHPFCTPNILLHIAVYVTVLLLRPLFGLRWSWSWKISLCHGF